MDITATFRGVCKSRRSLDKNLAGVTSANQKIAKSKTAPKPPRSEFQKKALDILAFITKVRNQIIECRKDYLEPGNGYGQTRHLEIETEIVEKLKSCSAGLSELRQDVHHNRTQIKVHRNVVVEILNSYLTAVSKTFTDQQAIRVKRELENARMTKLETAFKLQSKRAPNEQSRSVVDDVSKNERMQAAIMDEEDKYFSVPAKDAFSNEERQMFETENANLLEELVGMEDDVKRIENQLTEISKLQQVFTENVLVQEHQIDDVAATAVSATENIKAGNIDIREAIQKTASFRAWILFVVLVLSFTLLFLDWYNE